MDKYAVMMSLRIFTVRDDFTQDLGHIVFGLIRIVHPLSQLKQATQKNDSGMLLDKNKIKMPK